MPKQRNVYLFVSDGNTIGILTEAFVVKDTCAVPFMFHKLFSYRVTLVCSAEVGELHSLKYLPGVELERLAPYTEENIKKYIAANYEKMDLVILYGSYAEKYLYLVETYKKLRPAGKIYLASDANSEWMEKLTLFNSINARFFSKCDVIGVSGRKMTKHLSQKWPYVVDYIPNGFFNFSKCDMTVDFEKKENILLTVGRIGTSQKNNELLLNAFAAVKDEIPDWRLHLVGNIEDYFHKFIDGYFAKFPDLKNRVIFKGLISDKKELLAEYKRAKIFALTSTWEGGAPNVVAEALFCGCCTIISDIDAADDVIDNGKCGESFSVRDQAALQKILRKFCNNEKLLLSYGKRALKYAKQNYDYKKIIPRLNFLLFGREDEEEKLDSGIIATDIYGNKHCLLPLYNLFENKSYFPMSAVKKDGSSWYPLSDLVKYNDAQLMSNSTFGVYRMVVIMTMRELLKKQRPYLFLIAQKVPDAFIFSLSGVLKTFSDESKIFVAMQDAPAISLDNVYFIKNVEELYGYEFDFVFSNKLEVEKFAALLRPYGNFFWASAKFETLFEMFDESIILQLQNSFLLNAKFTPNAKNCFNQLSQSEVSGDKLVLMGKKSRVKNIVDNLKVKIKNNPTTRDILQIMEAEQIISEIYPQLVSQDIKYRINELKAALIGLHFGFVKKSKVKEKYKLLLNEIDAYGDFEANR